MAVETREQEIRNIWRKYSLFYKLLGAGLLICIGMLLGRLIYATPEADQAWGYGVNIYTSVISTAVTVLILDELNRRDARRDALRELKRQLVDDAASISNEIAKNAVHQLRRKGWLEGERGLLKSQDLLGANLEGASMLYANLQDSLLANANLSEAVLVGAKFQKAKLMRANLQKAVLVGANLENARLGGADLRGAELRGCNLKGAELNGAKFDTSTVLPDTEYGIVTFWTTETDMTRFTDPNHSDFWQPGWVKEEA